MSRLPLPRTVVKVIEQKIRTRVPETNDWTTQKVITARNAIVACSVCRNQVTRGLSELGDQLEGVERIGEGLVEASLVIIRGPVVRPIGPTKVQVPDGLGGSVAVTIGVNTLMLSETSLGGTVAELARESPANFIRRISEAIRSETSNCCRQQVWDRVMSQSRPRRTVKVKTRRTREVVPRA